MRRLLAALLVMALLSAPGCAAVSAETASDQLGKPLADFSVHTIDGGTFTLSEALKDHDMVFINLWATWCYYCKVEFPYLEEAYEQYSDRVAVIALSIEPTDTLDMMRDFAEEYGMTFAVGSDSEANLASIFVSSGIPTSLVVDRFGNVALVEIGAKSKTLSFTALFDYFLDDDYTETTILHGFPAPKPVAGVSEAELSAAANAEGSAITFRNSVDDSAWPMLPTEDGGIPALASSNVDIDSSASAVYATVTASEGDALAFEFRTSTQVAYDAMYIALDGAIVKYFSGEHGWTQWALPLEAGTHEIGFGYWKDESEGEGEDGVWLRNVRVVSGAEAVTLLDALPVYPVGDEFQVTLRAEDALPVAFDDPNGALRGVIDASNVWMVGEDSAFLDVTLTAKDDPETAVVSTLDEIFNLSGAVKADGSDYEIAISLEDFGFEIVTLSPNVQSGQARRIVLLDGESGAASFVDFLAMYGIETAWSYASEAPAAN